MPMEALPGLSAYLQRQGITSTSTDQEVQEAKATYRQLYHRVYYEKRKQGKKRFTMRMDLEEYEQFEHYAELHNRSSVSEFIKDCGLAYLRQRYLPRDEKQVDRLRKSVARIGNNINQVVLTINRTKRYGDMSGALEGGKEVMLKIVDAYAGLQQQVQELQQTVKTELIAPPTKLGDALWRVIQEDPTMIDKLQGFLEQAKQKVAE